MCVYPLTQHLVIPTMETGAEVAQRCLKDLTDIQVLHCNTHTFIRYSGTGPSDIGTTSLQRTLVVAPC